MAPTLLTVNQLSMLAGSPSINGLLIGCLANCQRIFLGGDPLADINIINSIIEPDTHISVAAQTMVKKGADFFRSFASNSGDTDLPSGFIFHNFTVAEGQTFAILDVADGADIDSSVGGILHINSPLVFGIFRSLFVL
jgi:hypothetical protein